ncbi:hypothetical protein [Enterococcus hirae]|uniref:hypothetical protein n=1 Tax=Enterococcus hirae TaxID=1354 RepID=UPI001370BD25|nr:hypothetical protein [Enterococcus hirae]NAE18218.1 hypothetical protein [Enterococcus hirae]
MSPTTYRKKPVEVEASRWVPTDLDSIGSTIAWLQAEGADFEITGFGEKCGVAIRTSEGVMEASPGDWIIREPFATQDRRFYPCKPSIFASTYDEVIDL